MPSLRDHLSDLPVRARLLANRTHVRASDWLDPRLRRLHVDNPRARVRHLLAGGRPARALATTPVARNRINPATGRPRWTDRSDGALARWRADRERAQGRAGQSGRAAGNQHFVRAKLADRQPQLARTLDRTVRDLSPRTGRRR